MEFKSSGCSRVSSSVLPFRWGGLYPPPSSCMKQISRFLGQSSITFSQSFILQQLQWLSFDSVLELGQGWFSKVAFSRYNVHSEWKMALKQSRQGLAKGILLFIITFLWIQCHLCFWSLTRHLLKKKNTTKQPTPHSPYVNSWTRTAAAEWCDGEGR